MAQKYSRTAHFGSYIFFTYHTRLLYIPFINLTKKKHRPREMNAITQAERQKYAEIFQARGQVNGYMSGNIRDEKVKIRVSDGLFLLF